MTTDLNSFTFATIRPEEGIKAVLKKKSTDIIEMLKESRLKGRGGAGFPTALKWEFAANAEREPKYVVCNADEGEPGTFKDRFILNHFPDLVIAGMTIGAMAIGSERGVIYLRGEYSYLRNHLEYVLKTRRETGLLGEDIFGQKGLNFDVEIRMGVGAYVCGEETCLIESLEGYRGEARNRPPFPVNAGFMGNSTIVNNVETFAWVTSIADKGVDWFKGIGTDKSSGLKLFSVSGDCEKPGIYEFPMGITIEELLKTVEAENTKAVQVGGASGCCIPSTEFTRTLAFEDASTGGSIIVFGQQRDMLEVAENFLDFFAEESCGQCTPCREGNVKLLEGVKMLKDGKCPMKYLQELCSLGETMQLASKCGLGQSSPNAFLSIVKNFKSEIMGRKTTAAHAG